MTLTLGTTKVTHSAKKMIAIGATDCEAAANQAEEAIIV
jgi:hypothetical protein